MTRHRVGTSEGPAKKLLAERVALPRWPSLLNRPFEADDQQHDGDEEKFSHGSKQELDCNVKVRMASP